VAAAQATDTLKGYRSDWAEPCRARGATEGLGPLVGEAEASTIDRRLQTAMTASLSGPVLGRRTSSTGRRALRRRGPRRDGPHRPAGRGGGAGKEVDLSLTLLKLYKPLPRVRPRAEHRLQRPVWGQIPGGHRAATVRLDVLGRPGAAALPGPTTAGDF
jgi:hypothetical protein